MVNPHDVVISSSICYNENYNTYHIMVIFERLDSEWSSKDTSAISLITETVKECTRDIINSIKSNNHPYSGKGSRSRKLLTNLIHMMESNSLIHHMMQKDDIL